jgi:transposase-like protein
MSRQSRRRHKPSFKAEVALAALRGDRTLQDLARQHKIHPTVIAQWRKQLLEGAGSLFERGAPKEEEKVDVNGLYRKIGQLEMERDFLATRPGLMSLIQRGGK